VFNADPREQRELFRRLRPIRQELEEGAGGPVVSSESARLHADFVAAYDEAALLRTQ